MLDEPLRGSTAGLFETGIDVRLEMATREDLQALGLECASVRLEGQVSRLKMLKRQMYGRANLDLLNRRFLLAAVSPKVAKNPI